MATIKYSPQVELDEHDLASGTKRVMLFGWDATNLQAVKMNVDSEGSLHVEKYETNDVEEVGAVTYIGKEKSAAGWMIQKIDSTSGVVMRYASVINNPTVTTYADAWTNRASTLVYDIYSETL